MSIRIQAMGLIRGALCAFACIAGLPAHALTFDVPSIYGTNTDCAGCHFHPAGMGNFSVSPPGTRLDTTGNFRTFLQTSGGFSASMPPYGADPPAIGGLTDAQIDAIRHYLTRARDGIVELNGVAGSADSPADVSRTFTFPTPVYSTESSAETLTVRFTNLRDGTATIGVSISGTVPGSNWFTITRNTCGGGVAGATDAGVSGGHEQLTVDFCEIDVKFTPKGALSGATSGYALSLSASWAVAQGLSPAVHTVTLHGTSLGPRTPIYSASGFNTLSVPGFSAATDSSQTKCPTISNTGSAPLQLAFSAVASGAPDRTGYYEIAPIGECAVVPAFAACVSPSATVTGSKTLPDAAGLASSCTLPIRFNPGKFGFAGGTGARAAQLVVTHNAPTAGTTATSLLLGNATTGPQPAIGLSPNPSVDGAGEILPPAFAAQIVNTTSIAWDLPVFNSGTADGLDLTEVTSDNALFTLTEDCVATPPLAIVVGNNPHCTVSLRFRPTATVKSCTTLTIKAAFSSNGPQVLQVCGTGIPVPAPKTSLSRASIDFGRRSIGAIYKPETVVITNLASATADLTLTSVAVVGTGFTIVTDPTTTACPGATLPPGTSCTVPIQFTPSATAPDTAYSATLAISSNDPLTPNPSVSLAAFATASALPVLEWTGAPAKVAFANPVVAGQPSAETVTVRLTDAGPGAVDVASVRLVGPDASSFAVGPCPTTLFQGEFCDVVVSFQPGSGGTKSAQIEVLSTSGVVPALLPVEGQAIGGVSAYLQASAASLAFGEVRVGTRSQPQDLRLTAFGGVVRVTALDVGAPYAVQSTTCPAVPFTLQLGSDCLISVTFEPSATSSSPAALSIGTDSGPQAVQVALEGSGTEAPDVSGGGCSIARGDSLTDPTLWLLGALAALALAFRRRTSRRRRD